MSHDDPCQDVANAALGSTLEFRGQRTSLWKDVVIAAALEFGNKVAKYYLPKGSLTAAKYAERIVDHVYASTAVGMLAWTWNSYNCANRTVIAGPFWQPSGSGGGGGGGGGFFCNMQHVKISFNGGQTWDWIYVEVCEYSHSQ